MTNNAWAEPEHGYHHRPAATLAGRCVLMLAGMRAPPTFRRQVSSRGELGISWTWVMNTTSPHPTRLMISSPFNTTKPGTCEPWKHTPAIAARLLAVDCTVHHRPKLPLLVGEAGWSWEPFDHRVDLLSCVSAFGREQLQSTLRPGNGPGVNLIHCPGYFRITLNV